jgi:hypothetical protein
MTIDPPPVNPHLCIQSSTVVQLAVLRRQLAFVEQLGHLGAIEEEEQDALAELLEDKLGQ